MREPIIHSHITDRLPKDHPRAYDEIFCEKCNALLHFADNDCAYAMWVESGKGNHCIDCFVKVYNTERVHINEWGLPDENE